MAIKLLVAFVWLHHVRVSKTMMDLHQRLSFRIMKELKISLEEIMSRTVTLKALQGWYFWHWLCKWENMTVWEVEKDRSQLPDMLKLYFCCIDGNWTKSLRLCNIKISPRKPQLLFKLLAYMPADQEGWRFYQIPLQFFEYTWVVKGRPSKWYFITDSRHVQNHKCWAATALIPKDLFQNVGKVNT